MLNNNQSIVIECLRIVWKTSLFYEMWRTPKLPQLSTGTFAITQTCTCSTDSSRVRPGKRQREYIGYDAMKVIRVFPPQLALIK